MKLFFLLGLASLSLASHVLSAEPALVRPFAHALSADMASALAALDTFNAEVNMQARYFIYLRSASWCSPCRREMPHFAKMYPEMKQQGVEIILISADKNLQAGKKFLNDFKAHFPGVMSTEPAVEKLPAFKRIGCIPYATIVDAKGNLVQQGSAEIIKDWKQIITQKQ